MPLQERTVQLHLLPACVTPSSHKALLHAIQSDESLERPRIVIDCSALIEMDRGAILLLICCLQEAMKKNGDVRLASLSKQALPVLEASGVSRVFETYKTAESAIRSFQKQRLSVAEYKAAATPRYTESEQAA